MVRRCPGELQPCGTAPANDARNWPDAVNPPSISIPSAADPMPGPLPQAVEYPATSDRSVTELGLHLATSHG